MADLIRVKGVGGEYAELLEAAGVDTVKEPRNRKTENLAVKIKEVNLVKHLTRLISSAKTQQGLVDQAKSMKPMVTH